MFPERFTGIDHARNFAGRFFTWHNYDRHSGIGYHTPTSVHYGTAAAIRDQRAVVLDAAYAAHPERFVTRRPTPPALPEIVYINPPEKAITH